MSSFSYLHHVGFLKENVTRSDLWWFFHLVFFTGTWSRNNLFTDWLELLWKMPAQAENNICLSPAGSRRENMLTFIRKMMQPVCRNRLGAPPLFWLILWSWSGCLPSAKGISDNLYCTEELWEPGSFWAFGVHSPTQQALNRNLDDSARCLRTALWPAGAPRKNEERELKACYSSTAREFNCVSMNLNLWRGLWAVHGSVYPPVSTVHVLFLMWFLNHSGKLLMKLLRCLLFTGYLHPHSTPATACSHPEDTRKYTETQQWTGDFMKTMSKCVTALTGVMDLCGN